MKIENQTDKLIITFDDKLIPDTLGRFHLKALIPTIHDAIKAKKRIVILRDYVTAYNQTQIVDMICSFERFTIDNYNAIKSHLQYRLFDIANSEWLNRQFYLR